MFFAFCYFAQLFHAFNGQFNIVYWKDPPEKATIVNRRLTPLGLVNLA